MTGFRLETGGTAIDRAHALPFTFDGRPLIGLAGDTIASALLASGVRIVGRSFKYHRPRGIWGAGVEEPNAIVDVRHGGRTTPNVRATTEPLAAGMEVRSVNAAPDAERDRAGLIDLVAPFLPAAFYYKSLMWPAWERFEPRIRAMAGLGRLDPDHDPDPAPPARNETCDLLVIGAGPAGLAAADAGARAGRRVILAESDGALGGALRHRGGAVDGAPWTGWAAQVRARIEGAGGEVLTSTTAYGAYDHGLVCLWQRPDRQWRVRPAETVLAAGAIERPLVHPDNDRPGVMSADAALRHLVLHAALPGRRIVVATVTDGAYPVAAAMVAAGAEVVLLDAREDGPEALCTVRRGVSPEAVHGRRGVQAVRAGGDWLPADALLVSGGWTPTVHLHSQARGKLRYREDIAALVPDEAPGGGLPTAGAARGTYGLAEALAEGWAAGGGTGPAPAARSAPCAVAAAWPDPQAKGRSWIDFQNDVTLKDVALAHREGFESVEHLKRYTTLGMATDQGRTSNMNGLAAMAALRGLPLEAVGTTTFRPPFVPVPLPVIAGGRRAAQFEPLARLPLEAAHRAAGADMREYGGWSRPADYGDAAAEARTARGTAGLFDASPLGKIEVLGPGAAELVDFNSYNRLSTLTPGRVRYGLMLTEGGTVYDDGVTLRLAKDRFVVSCSSGHVAGVRMRLEEWRQVRFDPRRTAIHDQTAAWTTLTVTGPRARALLAAAGMNVPDMPHMAVRETDWDGTPLRVARVSFTGDVSFELSVAVPAAPALRAALDRGRAAVDGTWIGMEAMLALRAEKGFVVVGKDTDGATMPPDLGMTGPRDRRRDEYVGKRSLALPEARREGRRRLVGLRVSNGAASLPVGAHVVVGTPRRSAGFVTSSHVGPALRRPVALGLVSDALAVGAEVMLLHLGAELRATLVPPCALDPEGGRLDA